MPPSAAKLTRRLSSLLFLAALPGCEFHDDPFQRPGTWHVENVNDANLAAMVKDKRQLVMGTGDDASPAVLSAQAVKRLLTDHVKPLPTNQLSPLSTSGGGGNN